MTQGWRCSACGEASGPNDQRCPSCGSTRLRGANARGDAPAAATLSWQCRACETVNVGSARTCSACGTAKPVDSGFATIADLGLMTTVIDRRATSEPPTGTMPAESMGASGPAVTYPVGTSGTSTVLATNTSSSSSRVLLIIAGALIAVTSLVVGLFVGLGSSQNTTALVPAPSPGASAPGPIDPSNGPGPSSSPDSTPPTSSTTTTTLAPGLVAVDISALPPGPANSQIALTFATYFGGINSHRNWEQVYGTFSTGTRMGGGASFQTDVSTTTDSNLAITSVTPQSDGSVVAHVTFTSQQDPAHGPNNDACDNWSLDYTLVSEPGRTTLAPGATPLVYFLANGHGASQAC